MAGIGKREFSDRIGKKLAAIMKLDGGLTNEQKKKSVDAFFETVQEALNSGEKVRVTGWGIFEIVERKAKMGKNPKTGVPVAIPAKQVVKFRSGSKLK